jgi:carbon-monoxide dehydrogenase medium subunit
MFEDAGEGAYLSGGHTLLPTMKQGLRNPSALIDLGSIPAMRGIEADKQSISIGAATCHADVAASADVRRLIPPLAALAGSIGDRHVRNRGTMGGSVANNDPAADYPSAVLGLGATVITDRRGMLADEFFTGLYETALEPDEIIVRIVYPVPQIAAYAKFRSAASRFPVAGVFISRDKKGAVRVAVTGAGSSGVFRVSDFEAALTKDFRPEALDALTISPSTMINDRNGTPEYRANLVAVMARRAMENPGSIQVYT